MRIPVYDVWRSMKSRCYYINNSNYPRYGARGITVCDEWKNSYETFESFCIENGWKKGLQLDRKDNDKGYYPDNCRFCTPKQNARNRSTNKFLTYKGDTKTYVEWADYIGIKKETFMFRLRRGWDISKIISIGPRSVKDFAIFRRKKDGLD